AYLKNVNDYNNNQAFASFGKKKYDEALEFAGLANNELIKAENSFSGVTKETVKPEESPVEKKKTPAFEAPFLIIILLAAVFLKKKSHY
ncbi:MAG: hypothetical protein J5U17_04775, partial [Candidatus Methanoperedens sp.]|nr:hypothetical protein [Candidatus Methanoperedens sp.]MCE8427726.1 hypothetical protein [Candidatus Methanoperedens sp.]